MMTWVRRIRKGLSTEGSSCLRRARVISSRVCRRPSAQAMPSCRALGTAPSGCPFASDRWGQETRSWARSQDGVRFDEAAKPSHREETVPGLALGCSPNCTVGVTWAVVSVFLEPAHVTGSFVDRPLVWLRRSRACPLGVGLSLRACLCGT